MEVNLADGLIEPDAESVFIPQLVLDLIQRLVERRVLEADDARELISYSLAKSAECNPTFSEAILRLSPFCERFAAPRKLES